MSEMTSYSAGIDLGRTPWDIATVRDGTAAVSADSEPNSASSSSAAGQPGLVERIAAAVHRLADINGAMPATTVLCVAASQLADIDQLAGGVARLLGLRTDQVVLIDESAALARGSAYLSRAGIDPGGAAAIGAALSGVAPTDGQNIAAVVAGGAAGAVVGGLGAAMLASDTATAAGAAITGPTGTALGTNPTTGPTGIPLSGTGIIRRLPRLPVVVAATAAVIIAAGVVVVASGGDDPPAVSPAPPTAPLSIVTDAPASTDPGAVIVTTVTTVDPVNAASDCVVGSWLADNDAYLAAMREAAASQGVTEFVWEAATGTVRLDINADGTAVTTYDAWTITSGLGGAGSALMSVVGVDTNTVAFADDGTYSVTATQIGSQTQVSSSGFLVLDGPSRDTLLQGNATYTCSAGRLEIDSTVASDFVVFEFNMVFTRSG